MGMEPIQINALIESAKRVVDRMEGSIAVVENLVTDKEIQASIKETLLGAKNVVNKLGEYND